ncbi:hypothetical protein [Pedobacter agri]|uniref:hypothetical protein n=1 Tax=Pedobacter agri TaxID=454586 RepID=UPI00292CB979|nr:hypothetical protein [Pedobacter agri]
MKTNIYNKKEHTEGYVGEGKDDSKSDVQKEYEKGNDGNVVTSFGQETVAEKNAHGFNEGNIVAKDGLDNTGTQGKDSLSDDAYNSEDKNPTVESAASGTGSSSKDFDQPIKQRDEDDVLNNGI